MRTHVVPNRASGGWIRLAGKPTVGFLAHNKLTKAAQLGVSIGSTILWCADYRSVAMLEQLWTGALPHIPRLPRVANPKLMALTPGMSELTHGARLDSRVSMLSGLVDKPEDLKDRPGHLPYFEAVVGSLTIEVLDRSALRALAHGFQEAKKEAYDTFLEAFELPHVTFGPGLYVGQDLGLEA